MAVETPTRTLADALHNALLFAGRDNVLPSIASVRIEYGNGKLELLATDRYRLSIQDVPCAAESESDPFAITLPRGAATDLAKALKSANKNMPIALSVKNLGLDDELLIVETDSSTHEYRTYVDGTYPNARSRMPAREDAQPTTVLAFDRKYLADLGKVKTESPVFRLYMPGYTIGKPAEQPVLAVFEDSNGMNGLRVAIMPARIAGEREE